MRITPLPLAGVCLIESVPVCDDRGCYTRTWCFEEFRHLGLDPCAAQAGVAQNIRRGIVRGMHWQDPPRAQPKVVRCTRGAIYDVVIDLRRESPTYCGWTSIELSGDHAVALYVPAGFAHGYQTLTDVSDVSYQMGAIWAPETERGIRWNDPLFRISWPVDDPILSARDRAHPDFVA